MLEIEHRRINNLGNKNYPVARSRGIQGEEMQRRITETFMKWHEGRYADPYVPAIADTERGA